MKTLATYTNIVDAQADKLILDGHQIDSVLLDEYQVNHQPFGVHAARLQVHDEDLDTAKDVLARQHESRLSYVKASQTRTRETLAGFLAGFVVAGLMAVTVVQLIPGRVMATRSDLLFAVTCGVLVGVTCALVAYYRARRVQPA